MRAGICSVQQALTPEAATVVKQAASLARRRGHTQVTPLHVASAMLASSASLLRAACRKTHSHPLQCKALELCFNVALNRLPTATSSPLFGPHCPHPSFSNALVAGFKRAQAHQRRGSVENQQQPILALKIEIEQLVISILDDPSVSRVMREAGFSSPQVKANVEQAVSLEVCSQSKETNSSKNKNNPIVVTNSSTCQFGASDDVTSVLDTLTSKKRTNSVIIGECLGSAESLIKKVMDKVERGEVHGDLRFVQFISLPLGSLKDRSEAEVEHKLVELKRLVKSYVSRGVVLYLGDLKWVSEFWSNHGEKRSQQYCPVEHMVMELRRLVCGESGGSGGKIWLMGIATFKTYMQCKTGRPSLETIWELHPLAIPVGSLDLSLSFDNSNSKAESGDGDKQRLTCCADCLSKFEREAKCKNSASPITTNLPFWLRQCREENSTSLTTDNQEGVQTGDLYKKWNSYCSSVHKPHFPEKTFSLFPSPSPSSSISFSSYDRHIPDLRKAIHGWPVVFEADRFPKEHQFWAPEKSDEQNFQPTLRMYLPGINGQKPDLLSNPNSSPNSASSSEAMEDSDLINRFNEPNSENMRALCGALEKKVPWQKDIIPDIASTVLECRAGKVRRKGQFKHPEDKEEVWLLFLGLDSEGKEKTARELAKLIFGSQSSYVSISLSSFSSTKADSTDIFSNKRTRDESGQGYFERFSDEVCENPHRVFFIEDVEQADRRSQLGMKRAMESGRISRSGGEVVSLEDAIVIFSCESLSSVSRACSPPVRPKSSNGKEKDEEENESLDLNIAIDEENGGDDQSAADMEILDIVDKQIIFKVQEL